MPAPLAWPNLRCVPPNPPCSAVLVDAVQKVGMRYRPGRQLWAAAVLLSTHGLELTLLKNYLDDGGDYHTCYKLCYNDLQVGALAEAGRAGGSGGQEAVGWAAA